MRESEFQEFIITLGYRYNEKTKTAFNSFEGFHTMVEFGEKDNRYSFSLDCAPKGGNELSALNERLRKYQTEHKNYVTRAVYKKKHINITLKMTIDSDIDKEEIRELVRLMTELYKSEWLEPLCHVCGRNRKTGIHVVGTELMAVCEKCAARKRKIHDRRVQQVSMKTQNMPAGLIGAVFGAVLGSALYVLMYQITPLFGVWSPIIPALCFAGFVIAGDRATKKSGIICNIIAAVCFLAAEYAAMIFSAAVLIEREGGGFALEEAVGISNSGLFSLQVLIETGVGLGLIAASGLAYYLKRVLTRPMKISRNIL